MFSKFYRSHCCHWNAKTNGLCFENVRLFWALLQIKTVQLQLSLIFGTKTRVCNRDIPGSIHYSSASINAIAITVYLLFNFKSHTSCKFYNEVILFIVTWELEGWVARDSKSTRFYNFVRQIYPLTLLLE